MRSLDEIDLLLAEAEESLGILKDRQEELTRQIAQLREEKAASTPGRTAARPAEEQSSITSQSSQEARIAFFRSPFRGRDDVYALRFENPKTGKTGYSPAAH
jgi:hypothetical protein